MQPVDELAGGLAPRIHVGHHHIEPVSESLDVGDVRVVVESDDLVPGQPIEVRQIMGAPDPAQM